MTESEWVTCTDPQNMLKQLLGKTSDRKMRLFACACCRRIWTFLTLDRTRTAVQVAEAYADGLVGDIERLAALQGVISDTYNLDEDSDIESAAEAVCVAIGAGCGVDAASVAHLSAITVDGPSAQATLLRDIFGNPFGEVILEQSCLSHAVRTLAQSIYDERAFDRLPMLADALEEAGCKDADTLSHCRQSGPHVRGCWAVDLILGKK